MARSRRWARHRTPQSPCRASLLPPGARVVVTLLYVHAARAVNATGSVSAVPGSCGQQHLGHAKKHSIASPAAAASVHQLVTRLEIAAIRNLMVRKSELPYQARGKSLLLCSPQSVQLVHRCRSRTLRATALNPWLGTTLRWPRHAWSVPMLQQRPLPHAVQTRVHELASARNDCLVQL